MKHEFSVWVDASMKPQLVLLHSTYEHGISIDDHFMRLDLDGNLEHLMVTHGEKDSKGVEVSMNRTELDLQRQAEEAKKMTAHELYFWLDRLYLKPEWRNGRFKKGRLIQGGE